MSAYEELVERCSALFYLGPHPAEDREAVREIVAEVLRTLETVTPEMLKADWPDEGSPDDAAYKASGHEERVAEWLAMLHASPLSPPKDKP